MAGSLRNSELPLSGEYPQAFTRLKGNGWLLICGEPQSRLFDTPDASDPTAFEFRRQIGFVSRPRLQRHHEP